MSQRDVVVTIDLIMNAFKGMMDKSGTESMVLHSLRIYKELALADQPEDIQIIGLLHDVLEDTDVTVDELYLAGLPQEIIDAVVVLTKTKDIQYFEYIRKVKSNWRARIVKIIDIIDNMRRLDTLPSKDEQKSMLARYQKALFLLIGEDFLQDILKGEVE